MCGGGGGVAGSSVMLKNSGLFSWDRGLMCDTCIVKSTKTCWYSKHCTKETAGRRTYLKCNA